MAIVALVGALFFLYCLGQVIRTWRHRDWINRLLWLAIIVAGEWFCFAVLL